VAAQRQPDVGCQNGSVQLLLSFGEDAVSPWPGGGGQSLCPQQHRQFRISVFSGARSRHQLASVRDGPLPEGEHNGRDGNQEHCSQRQRQAAEALRLPCLLLPASSFLLSSLLGLFRDSFSLGGELPLRVREPCLLFRALPLLFRSLAFGLGEQVCLERELPFHLGKPGLLFGAMVRLFFLPLGFRQLLSAAKLPPPFEGRLGHNIVSEFVARLIRQAPARRRDFSEEPRPLESTQDPVQAAQGEEAVNVLCQIGGGLRYLASRGRDHVAENLSDYLFVLWAEDCERVFQVSLHDGFHASKVVQHVQAHGRRVAFHLSLPPSSHHELQIRGLDSLLLSPLRPEDLAHHLSRHLLLNFDGVQVVVLTRGEPAGKEVLFEFL